MLYDLKLYGSILMDATGKTSVYLPDFERLVDIPDAEQIESVVSSSVSKLLDERVIDVGGYQAMPIFNVTRLTKVWLRLHRRPIDDYLECREFHIIKSGGVKSEPKSKQSETEKWFEEKSKIGGDRV